MRIRPLLLTLATSLLAVPAIALAETAEIGKPAPDFSLLGADGKNHSLSDYKGKTVVLEWYNPDCPFVKKHYASKNMQGLQKKLTDDGVVWLTVSASAPGKQGYIAPEEAKEEVTERGIESTAFLLDHEGKAGKLYEARTTPHMYVVDGNGTLAYAGAIDSTPSTDAADLEKSTNYVMNAVDAVKAGKPVDPAATEPYGCGVKYPS